jgi:hypothetical protein
MGCGWSPKPAANLSLVQAIEVVNGYDVETPIAGLPFWHEQLQQCHRLTAIGGSDTHNVTSKDILPPPGRIGVPTTVVYARELSIDAIVAGIRTGKVFVDTTGSRDRLLEFTGTSGEQQVSMGDELHLAANRSANFQVRVAQVVGGRIEVIRDGAVTLRSAVTSAEHTWSFEEKGDGKRHWIRIDVRDASGKLALIGNPIYVTAP